MTHNDLVARAARWLRNSRKCHIVLTECGAQCSSEIPDTLGWDARGTSYLVECKTTVADFRADRQKPYRRGGYPGCGGYRYYFTERGLLHPDMIPEGWGLLEVHPRGNDTIVREIVKAVYRDQPRTYVDDEMTILLAEMRRIIEGFRKQSDRCGVFLDDVAAEPEEDA